MCEQIAQAVAFYSKKCIGKVIEEYPDRKRVLIYAELEDVGLPVHIVVDYSFMEEPVIVTAYIPNSKHWIKFQIRKK